MPMDNGARSGKIAALSFNRQLALAELSKHSIREHFMSHHDHHHADSVHEPDPADSRADAIAAFCAIAIAVTGVLYFISQQ